MISPSAIVVPENDRLVITHPEGGQGSAFGVDRLCAKLKRRGWKIQRIGANRMRYAYPPDGHSMQEVASQAGMTIGQRIEWRG